MLNYLDFLDDIDDEQGMFTSAEEVATLMGIFGNQIEYLRDYLTVDSYENFADVCCAFAEYLEKIIDEGVDDPDLKDMVEFFYDLSIEIEDEFEGENE
jgi:hypothetical protein